MCASTSPPGIHTRVIVQLHRCSKTPAHSQCAGVIQFHTYVGCALSSDFHKPPISLTCVQLAHASAMFAIPTYVVTWQTGWTHDCPWTTIGHAVGERILDVLTTCVTRWWHWSSPVSRCSHACSPSGY